MTLNPHLSPNPKAQDCCRYALYSARLFSIRNQRGPEATPHPASISDCSEMRMAPKSRLRQTRLGTHSKGASFCLSQRARASSRCLRWVSPTTTPSSPPRSNAHLCQPTAAKGSRRGRREWRGGPWFDCRPSREGRKEERQEGVGDGRAGNKLVVGSMVRG